MRPVNPAIPTLLAALAFAACAPGEPSDPPGDPDIEYLSPTDHLIRASMALRGTRPSADELRAAQAEPDQVPAIIDDYLDSPEFGVTMRDLHNETLHLRTLRALPPFGALAGYTLSELNASIQEAPLKLIEYVVVNDRPYSEIVTADYALLDDIGATAWFGVDGYQTGGDDWQLVTWTDGRPPAGILSSSALFFTHQSAGANYHRGRANMISRALLCSDFLDRDVIIDGSIDLSDPAVVSQAVVANPACASCHQSLDPIASFLWGWRPRINNQDVDQYPYQMYGSFAERLWEQRTGRAPALFGLPGERLDDLGRLIADDPRFSLCAARRFYAYFAQVELDAVPFELAASLQAEFIDSELDAKALARAIVLSDEFRVSHGHTEDAASELVGVQKIRPEQLGRMIEALTGFRWEAETSFQNYGRAQLMNNDVLGFRVLMGGIDSTLVRLPSHTMTTTASLTLRALAGEAAGHVVEADASAPASERRLLTLVDPDHASDPNIRAQLVELHLRLLGEFVTADSEPVEQTYALFDAALTRTGDARHAWKTTLTAMLQDWRIAYY